MLYLDAPFAVLPPDGVTFYPDSENVLDSPLPQTYYYLPLEPRISVDSKGQQLLRLTKYVSATDAFAILDFDTNLGIDAGLLAKTYAPALQQKLGLKALPTLVPMLPTEGTVSVMLLGKQSSDPSSAGASSLVSGISYPAAPSLYDQNRAIFSILLTPAGSNLVEATLRAKEEEAMTAVGVIYSLTYSALMPAFRIRATAHWSQIHTSLKDAFSSNSIFFGSDISKVVDDMKDKRVISIDVDNMLSSDEQASAVQAMLSQVKSMIFDTFFQPALPPKDAKAAPGTLDGIADIMKSAGSMGIDSLSKFAHFTWTHEDRTDILTRDLTIDLNERTVQKLHVYPQAHLTRLLGPGDGSNFVLELNGDAGSDFFRKRTLQVDTNLPLQADGISSDRKSVV